MSEHAIEFLRGWIGEKVHCEHSPAKIEKQGRGQSDWSANVAVGAGGPQEETPLDA